MNVTLKPFDFAQAVARAGLAPDGQPLKGGAPVGTAGFAQALQLLGAAMSSASLQATIAATWRTGQPAT